MPVTCLVVGCGSRSNRDNVRFYSVPSVSNHKFLTDKNELSKKRRDFWIAAIKRDDLTESKLKNQRVGSRHFITEDYNHPDWVPAQNMGHESHIVLKRHEDLERKDRLDKRRKIQESETEHAAEYNVDLLLDGGDQDEVESGTASQTDLTMDELCVKFEQLSFAAKKIEQLEEKLEVSPYGLREETTNDEKWKYYTGFSYLIVNDIIFKLIEDNIICTSTTALSSFNQLLLTLIKLRMNYDFRDLAWHFKISRSAASTYFENIVHILYVRFKPLIKWPDRSLAQKNIPSCFREAFHDKTIVIIDCFEVFIEKPASLKTQQQCWSNYKHHNTIKFLIGITPQGTVSYISKAWGGKASDKQIVENSDFLNFILPGDIVLADRGFLIKDTLGILQAKLVIPAFTKGQSQLHPLDIEMSRNIAHVRIHVERIIGMIKNEFNIFKDTIPISMIKKGNDPEVLNILDKIVTVCCAFENISPPIVPL